MSRIDLNDVVRYRMLVTGALRLMGIWIIATMTLPAVANGLLAWWQLSSMTRQAGAFMGGGGWIDNSMLWGSLGQGALFIAIGLFLIIYARRLARRIIPISLHRCPGCDYDLGTAPPARCPECGLFLGESFHAEPATTQPVPSEPRL